jgi:GT2 family glycosyltransferase
MISSYINRYILLENCNYLDNNIILESLITSICKNIPSYDNDILNNYEFSQDTRKSILVSSPDQLGLGIEFHVNSVFLYNSLYIIIGWMVDFKKEIYSVRFVNNLGEPEIDFFESLVYFNRSDVTQYLLKSGREGASQCAFVCVKHTSHGVGSAIDVPKILEVRTKSGSFFQLKIDLIHLPNGKENLSSLMQSFSELSITYNSCKKIFGPIFKSISLENSKKSNFKISKNLYNQIEKKPTLSVIIPLYGSTRFEITQIPVIASLNTIDWEIIFAVDDVSIKSAVIDNVCRLSEYYNISMSIVSSDTNMGFAGINNLAFKQARADIVLFLNSDCLITNSAPILRGLQWLTTQTDAGAVGFRLLYADNSIQHDGMSIEKWVEQPDFLINVHPRSGLPSRLIPQHVNEDDAVLLTAACLMIPKSIFNAIDGFDTRYFLGDFEDSDICLKICSTGKKLGIVRSNDIFHLERQSFCEIDKLIQFRVTLTNSQIYTERWREFLNTRPPSLTVI